MIIDFSNINGGGGGGYVLPTATEERLGGVKIGEGINVENDGTISVTGGTGGGGIEVVTELPSSGTDGQIVLLTKTINEKHIHITGTGNNDRTTSITATGITEKTKLFDFNHYNTLLPVYVNPDSSYTLYNTFTSEELLFPVNSATTYSVSDENSHTVTFTGTVTNTGCVFTYSQTTHKANVISDVDTYPEQIQEEYIWTDTPKQTSNVYKSNSTKYNNIWIYQLEYENIPNGTKIAICQFNITFYHIVYEDNELRRYGGTSTEITASTYTTFTKYNINQLNTGVVYYDDNKIYIGQIGSSGLALIYYCPEIKNTGWVKNVSHISDVNVTYNNFTFYTSDLKILYINYTLNNVTHKINGTNYNLYSKDTTTLKNVFAPETSGTTGYVCVAGNGNVAPSWAEPSTLTNGVKFWKGTLDEYEAIGEGNYDANTLYICTDE